MRRKQSEALTKACGELALALRLSGSFLANRVDRDPEEYVEELHRSKSRLAELDRGRCHTDQQLGLEAFPGSLRFPRPADERLLIPAWAIPRRRVVEGYGADKQAWFEVQHH